MSEVRGQSVAGSYRGLGVDQSVDVWWKQEVDLLQQVTVLPEHSSDLHTQNRTDD